MAELINLNKTRKAKARADGKDTAAENRVRFGLTKVETLAARRDATKAQRELDGKKRDV